MVRPLPPQVNDVWRIDLGGADGYTWHAVPTVGDRPTPREGQASALLGGRYLVVHGGYVQPLVQNAPGPL